MADIDRRMLRSRYWDEGAACFNRDAEPEVQRVLADVQRAAEEVTGTAPLVTVTELFFPPRNRDLYYVYAERAKDFCLGKDRRHPCPVRRECLARAIVNDEEHGIHGGMSHRERNAMVRKAEAEGVDIIDYINRSPA